MADTMSFLMEIPALPPPDGIQPNFVNPTDTVAKPLIAVNAIFMSLAFIAVSVRVISKRYISRQSFAWDDLLCVIAMAGSITHTVVSIDNIRIGWGRHFWDIRALSLTTPIIQRIASPDLIYGVVIYVIKLSLLVLYHRLFRVYPSVRALVWGGVAICTIIAIPYIAMAIAKMVICSDISVVLRRLDFCGTKPVHTQLIAFGTANVISDLYILAIPLWPVRKLQLKRRSKKMALIAVFLVGFAACAMSITRLLYIAVDLARGEGDDVTYRGALISCFTAVELNLAIVCSCSVSFPPFYRSGKSVIWSFASKVTDSSGSKASRSRSEKDHAFDSDSDGPLNSPSRVTVISRGEKQVPQIDTLNMTRATIDMEAWRHGGCEVLKGDQAIYE